MAGDSAPCHCERVNVATLPQYLQRLRLMHRATAKKMGLSLQDQDATDRVLAASAGAVIAVIVKTLTDKGVITDADLEATWAEMEALTLPREPVQPVLEREPTYVPPEPPPAPPPPVSVSADHVFIWTIREPVEEPPS
jgi:hypothetical protein